ncbi:hypothetical protein HF086_012539 [Spodoptera exigua]|uniref:RNA-binding protein RO60 vWA domain-containing protein n=1 Tax=Spodoptera exigua TaxID=7107 RepID=A0A922SPC5_SPOEX|nr:hypothetical protein HF086_012539 [Spodoptera exigua]
MGEPTLEPELTNRLTRYLHTGNEFPRYYPGCWTTHKYFDEDKLPVLPQITEIHPGNTEAVDIILKACQDGYYTRFDTIAFALAKCLQVGNSSMKEAAYKAAMKICVTPEQMMLFTKFTRLLKTARDAVVKYAIYGLKHAKQIVGDKEEAKAIFNYIQKVEDFRHCEDPLAAAAIATQNQFTLDHVPGHLLTSQEVWDAVLPEFSLEDLLHNIQRIHNMGFLDNDSTTTSILVSLLSNKDKIKKSKVTALEVYITMANYSKKSKPMKYEKAKVALEREARRRTRQIFDTETDTWKVPGIDQPPNPAVLTALNKLVDLTWALTPPTNARYLITMDMRHHMFKAKKGKKAAAKPAPPAGGGDADTEKKSKKHFLAECFYNVNVTPGHAAIVLALQLLKRENHVDLAVFTEEGIQIVSVERNFSNMEEAEFLFRNANLGRVQLDAPINYAMKNHKKYDVFINMVDRTTRYMELDINSRGGRGPGGRYGPPPPPTKEIPDHCPVRALQRYRTSEEILDAKLVVMSLASHKVCTTDGTHEGVLDIVGIDEHVPKILDAFVLGQFK